MILFGWDNFTPAQWAILFGVILIVVALILADMIDDKPWGGFGDF